MPSQKIKSGFDFKDALGKAAAKPMQEKRNFGQLPGGITNGVARLTKLRLGVYESGDTLKGKQYFRAEGVVIEPKSVSVPVTVFKEIKGHPKGGVIETISSSMMNVSGLITSIMIPLVERKTKEGEVTKSVQDQIDAMVSELKWLGGDDCCEGLGEEGGLDALFELLTDKDTAPYFKFNTEWKKQSKEYPEQGVWDHRWLGRIDDYEPPDGHSNGQSPAAGVEDDTPEEEAPAEEEAVEEETTAEVEQEQEAAEDVDLDALAKVAGNEKNKGHVAARQQLTAIAVEAGVEEADVENADTWNQVVEMINASKDEPTEDDPVEEEAAEEEAAEEWKPSKGEVVLVKLVNSKTKKLFPKASECEVLSVDAKGETVSLKNLDTGATIVGVDKKPLRFPFAKLEQQS